MAKIKFGSEVYTWFMQGSGKAYDNKLAHMIKVAAESGFTGIEPMHFWMGDLADPNEYRYEKAREVEFRLSEEASHEMEHALAVWTTHIKALSKLVTRIKVDWQVRECVPWPVGNAPALRHDIGAAIGVTP